MIDIIDIGILTIGNLRDTHFQILHVIVQAVGSLLHLCPLFVPFTYFFGICLIISLQFLRDDLITGRGIIDRSTQAAFHQFETVKYLRRHVECHHSDEHQIHQVDHLLTGRIGIICYSCHIRLLHWVVCIRSLLLISVRLLIGLLVILLLCGLRLLLLVSRLLWLCRLLIPHIDRHGL